MWNLKKIIYTLYFIIIKFRMDFSPRVLGKVIVIYFTPFSLSITGSKMEKAYKIAHAKLWVWKISTQNMCKKCPKSCKTCKNGQNCNNKKRQKTLIKRVKKTKQKNSCEKLAHATRPLRQSFSISAPDKPCICIR